MCPWALFQEKMIVLFGVEFVKLLVVKVKRSRGRPLLPLPLPSCHLTLLFLLLPNIFTSLVMIRRWV